MSLVSPRILLFFLLIFALNITGSQTALAFGVPFCHQSQAQVSAPRPLTAEDLSLPSLDPANPGLLKSILHYLNSVITPSRFEIHRGFWAYVDILNRYYYPEREHGLIQSLAKLRPDAHVMDTGAGYGRFIMDFFSDPNFAWLRRNNLSALADQFKSGGLPRFTGVTLTDVSKVLTDVTSTRSTEIRLQFQSMVANPQVQFFMGRLFEKIPVEELIAKFGRTDLIVDSYGVLSYTLNLPLTLRKMFAIMKPGSELATGPTRQFIQLRDGREISLLEFLKGIDGIQVTDLNDGGRMIITKLREDIVIPDMVLTGFQPMSKPPKIIWKL
jgi:hypothetical protein